MRIHTQLLSLIMLGTIAVNVNAQGLYNPTQLEQFEKTNQCVGCDLSGARMTANHSGAILENANLSSIHPVLGTDFNFSSANMRNANLSGADLENSNFSNAILTGAHFDGADIRYANFSGAIGADLKNAEDACSVIMPDGKLTKEC